jgi:hypothetical protein
MKRQRSKGWRLAPCLFAFCLAAGFCLGTFTNASASLTIHSRFAPSIAPSDLVGGGNLEEVFNAAAASWERAFTDPSDPWEVDLTYEWAPLTNAQGLCQLVDQGGTPHRILSARILFDNSGDSPFFADSTRVRFKFRAIFGLAAK